MKILLVLENYWPHVGGVESLFQNLAEGLVKKGYKVTVVTHKLKGTRKHETKNGVEVYRVGCAGSRYLFTCLSIFKVLKFGRKADLIHTTTFNGAPPSWLASKLLRKKCLLTVHEVWIGKWHEYTDFSVVKSAVHNLLERMIFILKFDTYAAVSKSTKKQLVGIGISKNKIRVNYNGLDYGHFKPSKNRADIRKKLGYGKEFVCFSYGRLGPSKGVKYAIKAVPRILASNSNFKYVLALSKDKAYAKKTKALKEIIRTSKFKKNIQIISPVSWKELPAYIAAADCVVVPSLAEGFGYTVAEACAVKTPVVATNTTSIPEVISNKFKLVPTKNSNAIAKGVESIRKDVYDTKPLKKFTLDKMVQGYIDIYIKLLEEDNEGRSSGGKA